MNRFFYLSTFACVVLLFVVASPAQRAPRRADGNLAPAATLTVTKTADTNDGVCNSDCSLREAVAAANAGDTIVFASPLFDTAQTISISGQIVINKSLTINGRGASLTTVRNVAPAGPTSRVLLVTAGPTTLSGLTVSGGNLTAGVNGSACGPTLVCGGGIHSLADLTIIRSVIADNTSSSNNLIFGGGIYSYSGVLRIDSSTISGNRVVGSGGDIGQGGGIFLYSGQFTLVNTTIWGNAVIGVTNPDQGGGLLLNSFASAAVFNSTITGNSSAGSNGGGGVRTFTNSTTIVNSIITGNRSPGTPDFNGPLAAGSTNNLIGVDAKLYPIGNYFGPTPTLALAPDSPALNAGTNCVVTQTCTGANPPSALATDQRGRTRDSSVDIGAYEVVGLTVTKTADTDDGVCDADCSLREAIAAAVSGDTIRFASPLFDIPQTIQTNGQLTVDKTLVIGGRGSKLTAIQNIAPQSATSRVFLIDLTGNLTLSNVTVTGGNTVSGVNGGGILNRNVLTVIDCQISGNNGAGFAFGGGIYSEASVTLINSTLTANSAAQGGGLYGYRSNSLLVNTTVSGNVGGSGGGLYFNFGIATIRNSTITANTSTSVFSTPAGIDILNNPSVNLGNTILAGNSTNSGTRDYLGTLNSLGYNIIGNTNLVTFTGDTTGNILNVSPNLAPLGFYGGTTMTHALLSGSPAINAGTSTAAPATDQRGAARVGNVDIGAFEANSSANGGTFRAVLPAGIINAPYSYTIAPNNGSTTYAVTGGALPPGLNLTTALAPSAVVSLTGTPTSGGIFNFSITATNGANTSVTDYSVNIVVPTAAGVSVSGRVVTSDGRGLRNATVTMTDANGVTRSARTGTFGYYVFEDIGSGQVMTFNVKAKRASFTPQVVYIGDSITDLDFVEGVF